MKKILLIAFVAFFATALQAQKTVYDPNAQVRTVGSFHAIQISNAFDVILTQGNEESLAVSANNKDLLPQIKTEVENGVLKIWFSEESKWWKNNRKLKAYISVRNLDELKASGASDINIEGTLKVASLNLQLTGASDLSGELVVSGNLDAHLSGASDMDITGSANNVSIDASGASEVKAYDFKTSTANVEASGASGVRITVEKELSAKVSGASSVTYKGNAVIRDIKTSGASNVSRKS